MAGFISQESIEAVKSAADIVSVAGEYVKLERRGQEFWGCCPFHGEKTASLRLYDDYFHCFGCGAHGDIISFVQKLKSISPLEAAKELADMTGISYSTEKTKPVRNAPTRSELLRYYAEWEKVHFGH